MKTFFGAYDIREVAEKGYNELSDKFVLSSTWKDSLKDLRKRDKKIFF